MIVRRFPDFIIIGAMKCGTSSLHEQLALRPSFFMSDPKEPNFFSDDEQFARGVDWYTSLFEGAREDQRRGESSTHYSKLPTYPHTVERIRNHLPKVKLIYMMRDPIQRIISQYIHEWTQREVRSPFEAAVRRSERYVAYSCYARQLEPFLCAYGANALLPVFFERMLQYPDEELARVCRFIGDRTPGPIEWNRDLPPQNVSDDRLRMSPLRAALRATPGARALKSRLPSALQAGINAIWQMRRRPELSPGLRAELESRIDEDLRRLGAWLGVELTSQGWQEQVLARPVEWVDPPSAS